MVLLQRDTMHETLPATARQYLSRVRCIQALESGDGS